MAYDPTVPVGTAPSNYYKPFWDPNIGDWRSSAPPDAWGGDQAAKDAFEAQRQYNMNHDANGNPIGFGGNNYAQSLTNSGLANTGPHANTGQGTASGNAGAGTPATLGGLAGGGPSGAQTPMPNVAMSSFINPMAQYMQDWANKGLQSSYAGAGNFLSGPAAQGIAQFNQNAALNNAWQPAFGDYMANQQQQYNMALNDQTIPFNQQMQLAQLGLQGSQGAGSLSSALAAILSGNLSNLGQVQGTGTMGTNNSIMSALNQFLANIMGQNTLNQIIPH